VTDLVIRTPDDMHVHLREADMLRSVVGHTSDVFARALVMPNTAKPVLDGHDVAAYRHSIVRAVVNRAAEPSVPVFEPLMSVKLVRSTTPDVLSGARLAGAVAAKFYPEGVTTNSEDGVADIRELEPALAAMERLDMVLCLHGEVPGVFCMDREAAFLESLRWVSSSFPKLRVVLEHVTTAAAVDEVLRLPGNVAATITAHHLFHTLDDVVGGMLSPHAFCKPIAKTPKDREVLRAAATSGDPKFFFGSDSAPHGRQRKECSSGCAGVFSAPCALEALAIAFEEEYALHRLEQFVSAFGAWFYGLPLNDGTVTLSRLERKIGDEDSSGVVPLFAGRIIPWSVTSNRYGSTL
jgi:dihydroorotase